MMCTACYRYFIHKNTKIIVALKCFQISRRNARYVRGSSFFRPEEIHMHSGDLPVYSDTKCLINNNNSSNDSQEGTNMAQA